MILYIAIRTFLLCQSGFFLRNCKILSVDWFKDSCTFSEIHDYLSYFISSENLWWKKEMLTEIVRFVGNYACVPPLHSSCKHLLCMKLSLVEASFSRSRPVQWSFFTHLENFLSIYLISIYEFKNILQSQLWLGGRFLLDFGYNLFMLIQKVIFYLNCTLFLFP